MCDIIYAIMDNLTLKQKKVLEVIQDLKKKLGNSPTLEEIRKALNYSGVSSVQRHIDVLKKKGYLSNKRYQARSLEVSIQKQIVEIPLLGNVAAGNPSLAPRDLPIEAWIPYEASKLRGSPQNYFFLHVIGDSMNRAGINDGDYVLVKKQETAEIGQKVAALIGNEVTIKKYKVKDKRIVLDPESDNPQNKPIVILEGVILEDEFSIKGIVIDVVSREEN